MDRSVRVRLGADITDYVANLAQANRGTKELAGSVDRLTDFLDKSEQQTKANAEATKQAASSQKAWKDASTGMLAFGGATLAGVGVAVKAYADFDRAISDVKATGADAATSITQLREAALKAGKDFGQFSATDAAQGIEALAKAGVSAADILSGGLNGALTLAAAGQIAVGDAAEVTAKTLAQFQLQGKDATRVADLLAAGAGKAVGDVADFGMALAQAGTVANQYGISVEETTGTLALFAQNALLGSDAGTSMKAMLLQLASPTKQAQKTLDDLGISAYDANGEFVGMAGLADQLKDRLGDLSQEQQNAALKTIFGADAIRAASILMREGGDGVRQWTKDVSEQGYAAQVAATKMDNLQGDLAALAGSWETLTIRMGEAGNGPLRSAVQWASNLVDTFAELPPAMQGGMLGVAAATGGLALMTGAAMKGVTAISDARSAWNTLSTDFPKGAKAAKAAAGAMIGLAAAMALVTAAQAYDDSQKQVRGIEASTRALLANAKAGGQSNEELDKFFQKSDGSNITNGVNDLAGAFKRLNPEMKTTGQQFNDVMSRGVRALTGGQVASEVSKLEDQFREMDRALAQMANNGAADQAAANFRKLRASAEESKFPLERLVQLMPDYHAQLQAQANQLGVTTLSTQDYADWMGGKVPPAIQAAADAAKAKGKDISTLGLTMGDAAQNAKDLADAYLDLANTALQLSGSQIGVKRAINDAMEAAKENGKTLDLNTAKGLANQDALDGIARAALALIEAQQKNNASAAELTKTTQENRDAFIRAAEAMGMEGDEAAKLADKYGLIPKEVATKFSADTKSAEDDLNGVAAAVGAIPSVKIVTIRADNRMGALGSAIGLPMQARAGGGPVWGAGTNISDSIITALSNGEFVIKQSSAASLGYGWLEELNRLGRLPSRAGGGPAPTTMPARVMPPSPAMYAPGASSSFTFAPAIQAYGPDARELSGHLMSSMRHEMRAMVVPIPGGAA